MNEKTKEQYREELEELQKAHNSLKATVEREKSIKEVEDSIVMKQLLWSKEFIQLTDVTPDYNKILQVILDISGAKYAALNIFEEDGLDFTTVAFVGINENVKKGLKILGFNVSKKHWKHDPVRAEKTKRQISTRFADLRELTGDVIPNRIILLLEKKFRIGESFVVKVVKGNKVLGDFTLIFEKGETLKYNSYVELFANQVGLFLDRNKTRQVQKESEYKLRNILENTASVFFSHTTEHVLTYLSPQIKDMLGYTQEEAMIKWTELVSDNPINEIGHQHTIKAIKTGKRQPVYNLEVVKKNGEKIWVEVRENPIVENGKVVSIVGSLTDVMERIQAGEELENKQLLLGTIIDNIPDAVYTKDLHLRKTLCNSADLHNIGANSESEVLGKDDFELFPKEIAEKFYADDKFVIQKGIPLINREEILFDNNGLERWLLTSKIPLRDNNKKIVGLIGIGRDITERKKAEQALKESEKELIKLNADKDLFISILGHDLRSPFNSLLGLSELLSKNIRQYDSEKIEKLADSIHKSAEHNFVLLVDLLNWARADQGSIPFVPKNLSLRGVCNDVLETLAPTADEKSISTNCWVDETLDVFADVDMLKTVLRNLVANAIKFTSNGGSVDIKAEKDSQNLTITVGDNGIGISSDDLPKLFDISEKITTTGTSGESGTGLGLMLCKDFVEKHGGKIRAESQKGKGSEFIFTLPNK